MKHRHALFVTALLALSTTLNHAQEAKPEPKAKEEKKKPAPTEHVAKAGPFKIEVELDALFSSPSDKEHKISLTPKSWGDMTVLSALPHGARVKKGDKLINIDTEKLKKAIREVELAEPAAKLALKIAEAEVTALEETTPRQLTAARRNKSITEENWKHYENTGHPEAVRAAKKSIQFAQQGFEYAKEEYEQLKKMYEADDLTEETEEIILKRAKTALSVPPRTSGWQRCVLIVTSRSRFPGKGIQTGRQPRRLTSISPIPYKACPGFLNKSGMPSRRPVVTG